MANLADPLLTESERLISESNSHLKHLQASKLCQATCWDFLSGADQTCEHLTALKLLPLHVNYLVTLT